MSLTARRRRARRTSPFLAVPLALTALALGTAPAQAASTTYAGTDSATDAQGGTDANELLSGTATYDADAGAVSLTVVTKATTAGVNNSIIARFGHLVGGTCSPVDADGNPTEPGPVIAVISAVITQPATELSLWNLSGSSSTGQADATRSGTKTALSFSDDALKGLAFDCVQVTATGLAQDSNPVLADELTLLPGGSAGGGDGGASQSGGGSPVIVTTDLPDADKDGVPDTKDKCPKVAGADAKGCPTVTTKNEFKLGAKRVVFDRLTKRMAKVCPAKAAAIVTAKGKRLGKSVVAVETHGAYCYVKGVVKMKKRASKVRLVVKATGMGSVAKTLKR